MANLVGIELHERLYALIGVVLCIAVLTTYRRLYAAGPQPRSVFQLSFEGAFYLAAAFAIAAVGSYNAAMATTFVGALKWSQVASIAGQMSLLWLVARLTRLAAKPILIFLTLLYVISLLMHVVLVSGVFMTYLDATYLLGFPWSEDRSPKLVSTFLWRTPITIANVSALAAVVYACVRQYCRRERFQALLVGGFAAVILMGNLHDMYFEGTVRLAPLGLLFMLAAFLGCPDGRQGTARVGGEPDGAKDAYEPHTGRLPWAKQPLLGVAMTMLLVTAAQALASEGISSFIVLLSLMGMAQATMGVLYRVGSGQTIRRLAILALVVIALPQVMDILYGTHILTGYLFEELQVLSHAYLRDWFWIFGLLLLLSAFHLAGIEVGEAREKLVVEQRQLVTEVDERRRAERELQASEKRFRALIENSTDIIAILGADGTIRYMGPSIKPILGFEPEELTGKSVEWLSHPDDRARVSRAMKRVSRRPGMIQSIGIRIRSQDGTWRAIEGTSQNLLSDPALNGIVVNARDITDRKLMAERLESIRVEEQQRIRRDLHDTIGQDLAGLLCMAGSLSLKLQKISETCSQQADALVEGVQRTMEDVRKVIQGIAPIETDPRGLEIALRQLVERLKGRPETVVRFDCNEPVRINDYGVAMQLFRIAQEGLTNAMKHAKAREIVVALHSDHEKTVLAVTDDGVGMNGQERPSAGIGLHTMKSRAAAIGASLRISTAADGGVCVQCVLARHWDGAGAAKNGGEDFVL